MSRDVPALSCSVKLKLIRINSIKAFPKSPPALNFLTVINITLVYVFGGGISLTLHHLNFVLHKEKNYINYHWNNRQLGNLGIFPQYFTHKRPKSRHNNPSVLAQPNRAPTSASEGVDQYGGLPTKCKNSKHWKKVLMIKRLLDGFLTF